MLECSSVETHNIYPYLNDQQQFRLNKINEVKENFIAEKFLLYIALFDYFDKSLIVLFATFGSISIASFASVIGAPVGRASASFTLAFSMSTGIIKKLLKTTRKKKKNHNKIVMLARSKLNSKEIKISEALMNNDIGHEDFMTIINEEKKLSRIKRKINLIHLIEEGKKIGIDEVIKRNEIIKRSLKFQM